MSRSNYHIDIVDQQQGLAIDFDRVRAVIERVLEEERIPSAEISVALVDDAAIHRLNREFLGHDYPTDVISFRLSAEHSPSPDSGLRAELPDTPLLPNTDHLEAELVISTETALRESSGHGWPADDELLLYVVHGTLHLCGYDDLTDAARPIMRDRERHYLARWLLVPTGLEA